MQLSAQRRYCIGAAAIFVVILLVSFPSSQSFLGLYKLPRALCHSLLTNNLISYMEVFTLPPKGNALLGAWLGKAYISLFHFCFFFFFATVSRLFGNFGHYCLRIIYVFSEFRSYFEIQERDEVCVSLAIALGTFS